jgi:hypothetical protein
MSNYYPQSDDPGKTLTVGELVVKLLEMPQESLIVFTVPEFGAFGSGMSYTIATVEEVELPRHEHNCGKQEHYDEDTDEVTHDDEDYIQVFNAWKGVVIK